MSKGTSLHVQFMKKNIYLKRLCLLLLVVLCTILLFFLQYRYDNKYHFPGIQGEQGILDLRSDRQPLSVLTYGWEIYPQKLIAPGEFNGQKPHFIYLGQYGGFEAGDKNGNPHGCATYRLTILLPPEVNEYALELPEIYSASRIWVNGRPVSILGDVTSVNPSPSIRTGMITFSAAGKAELVVQAADTRHYYSGMVYPPAFGSTDAVSDLISLRFLRTCIMVIASLTIGILYLFIGIKTGGERRRMILFSLVCLFFTMHVMYPLFHSFVSYRNLCAALQSLRYQRQAATICRFRLCSCSSGFSCGSRSAVKRKLNCYAALLSLLRRLQTRSFQLAHYHCIL